MVERGRFVVAGALAFLLIAPGAVLPADARGSAPVASSVTLEGGFDLAEATELERADGSRFVSGRVVNRTGRTVESVGVQIDQLDGHGGLVTSVNGYTGGGRFDDGEAIPFISWPLMGAGPHHWVVRKAWFSPGRWPANINYTTTVTDQHVDAEGGHHLVGAVRNDNTVCGCNTASRVAMTVTYLDAAGRAVGFGAGFADDQGEQFVAPGATTTFQTWSGGPLDFASFELRADGLGSPMPLPTVISSVGGCGSVRYGEKFTLSGVVMARGVGAPASYAGITLLRRFANSGAWDPVWFGQADGAGRYAISYQPEGTADYQVQVHGSDRFQFAAGPAVHRFAVGSKLGKLAPSGARNRPLYSNLPISLSVTAYPSARGRTVLLERKVGKKWTKVGSRRTNDQGRASFIQRLAKPGTYTFRTVLKPAALNGGVTGPATKIKVGGPWAD